MFIYPFSKASIAMLLALRENEIKPLVDLLTGHGLMKNHLLRMGCVEDDVCRFAAKRLSWLSISIWTVEH